MDMVIQISKSTFWIMVIGAKLLIVMYFLSSAKKEPENLLSTE